MRILSAALIASTAVLLGVPSAASADTFTVTKTADTSDGSCDADCSLREAILAATAGTPDGPHTVVVGAGEYQNSGGDYILGIGDQVTITGAGARSTTLREVSGGDGRVFLVEQDAKLTIADLAVTGTSAATGALVLDDAALEGSRVAFRGNSGLAGGGAIANSGGSVTLSESALTGNSAASAGAGVYQSGAGPTLSLTNVTVAGNSAPGGAGITVETGSAVLRHVTLAGNTGSADLSTAAGATSVSSSIVGGCAGAPVSLGFNLDPGPSCGLSASGDKSGVDPKLAPLAENEGPTDTMAIDGASPAWNAAGPCPPPARDQRGVARPDAGACDIGAYEWKTVPFPPLTAVSSLRIRRLSRRAFGVRYRLSKPDKIRFTVARARRGRWVRVRSFSEQGADGRNSFRMKVRGLHLGLYRLKAKPAWGLTETRRFRVKAFRP